jgi:hypothetical protein
MSRLQWRTLMSAFFCNDTTLSKCVVAILTTTDRFGDILTYRSRCDDKITDLMREQGTKIGKALRAMNATALECRYGDRYSRKELDFRFLPKQNHLPVWPKAHLLKALNCFHYQCYEGHVPETNPLFNELARVIGLVACEIAEALPEYKAAPWSD